VNNANLIYESGKSDKGKDLLETLIKELYSIIGQQQVELEFIKKT